MDEVERVAGGLDAHERGDRVRRPEPLDELVQRRVGQRVAVVGQEDLIVVQVAPDRPQALAEVRVQAGVGEADAPVVDVAAEELDLAARPGDHEVVREGLVVAEEVLLDHVRLVAQASTKSRWPKWA